MTLKDAVDQHGKYSERTSENVRFLALAGLGVVWLLAGGRLTGLHQKDLLGITGMLVLVLLADFVQYACAAETYDRFVRRIEEKRPRHRRRPESPVRIPPKLVSPIYGFYWAKITLLVVSYLGLASVLLVRLVRSGSA